VDSPCHKFTKGHKGGRERGGGWRSRRGAWVGGPITDQHGFGAGSESVVCACYKLGRRDVAPNGEGGVEHMREACWAFLKEASQVC